MADRQHLWRIFDNLMNNICKYSMPGTRVYLTLKRGAAIDGDSVRARALVTFRNISKTRLNVSEDQVAVDIALMVSYGYPIQEVARAVQDAVASAVENTCGLPVAGVNVSVTGVTFKR